ncbi:MAG: MBL fold metallo-hydrolase [Candidatus Sulfotelmatobacter sp.]
MSDPSRITTNTQRSSLELRVFTSPTRVIAGDPNRTFSPTTSMLIFGASDAVLVNALLIKEDVDDALGDMIASTGTTIFITHGHGDHFCGSDRLLARFPSARAVSTPGIVDYINSHIESDAQLFSSYFGDTVSKATSRPAPLDRGLIDLEGHELRVIEVGQGDIAPSAVLTFHRSMPWLPATSLTIKSTKRSHSEDRLNGTSGSRALVSSSVFIPELSLPVTRNPKPPMTKQRRCSTALVPISRISQRQQGRSGRLKRSLVQCDRNILITET